MTEFGITRDPVREEQVLNALSGIVVTEFPMVSVPSKPHVLNAPSPIEVTEFGIVREPLKPWQF